MRRFLLAFACVSAFSATARAGRQSFLGFSPDGSWYATCEAGFDTITRSCTACLVDPKVPAPSWPKELAKPDADGCADACDFPDEELQEKCGQMQERLGKLVSHRPGATVKDLKFSAKRVKDSLVVTVTPKSGAPLVRTIDAPGPRSKWLFSGMDALADARAVAVTLEPDTGDDEMADMVPSTVVLFTPATLAREKARSDAQAQNVAGMAAYKKKDWAAAAKAFRAAIAIDPTHVLAHYNLACVAALAKDKATVVEQLTWLRQSGTDEALKRLEKARTDPDLAAFQQDPDVKKLEDER